MDRYLKVIKHIITLVYIKFILPLNAKRRHYGTKSSIHDPALFGKYPLDILGVKIEDWPYKAGNNINFNTDPVSSIELESKKLSKLIKFLSLKGFDIKTIWDISRFQFIPYSKSPDVFIHIPEMIFSFMKDNPVGFGPNWICSMDIAIRGVNMIELFDLVLEKGTVDNKSQDKIKLILLQHLNYVYENLEWVDGYRGNHYLSNICGLLIIGSRFDCTDRNNKILSFACSEFVNELKIQFNDDGTYYENSTKYHHLATEMVFYTLDMISMLNGDRNPSKLFIINKFNELLGANERSNLFQIGFFRTLLGKASEFLKACTLPDGRLIIVGDNDSGRFMNLDYQFQDQFAGGNQVNIDESAFTLLNLISLKIGKQKSSGTNYLPTRSSKDFNEEVINSESAFFLPYEIDTLTFYEYKNFGILIYSTDSFFFSIRNNYTPYKQTHGHEDLLSVILFYDNQYYLWDPGMPTYTRYPEIRNEFRFAGLHNSPIPELAEYKDYKLFQFKYHGVVLTNFLSDNLVGVKYSYKQYSITRSFQFYQDGIRIFDVGDGMRLRKFTMPNKFSLKYGTTTYKTSYNKN